MLYGAVTLLAEEFFNVERLLVGFLVERNLCHHCTLFLRYFFHIVVEVGELNLAVLVGYVGYQLAKHVDWVCHRTAEVSRMQVVVRACNLNLPVSQTTKANRERRYVLGNHTCVGNENNVALEQFLCAFRRMRPDLASQFLLLLRV